MSLGILEPLPDLVRERGEQLYVGLLGRAVPVEQTPEGIRAIAKGKPGNPAQVAKYLASKFGPDLEAASGLRLTGMIPTPWRELSVAHRVLDILVR